ncbi:hypothetical protein FRB93_006452 [Tulasnella sp. JGI-2019a]|nr:hypothetical protein FRB93_006452 [Tulasnella sp. JGI-2019a]
MTSDKKRISREAAIWHPLRHINVLEFLGVVNMSDTTYLVSPWMELGDLRSFVTSRIEFLRLGLGQQNELGCKASLYRRFKEQAVITGIASGLAYLHSNHVIHGDLKAVNILLDNSLQPKICDFGLTKVLYSSYDLTSKALKGVGTYRWMSPELLKGDEHTVKTTASDVYAFGIVIAEILSARVPFSRHGSTVSFALAVIDGERPQLEPLSREGQPFQNLWDLAASCWKSHPPLRPTANDIVAILASDKHSISLRPKHQVAQTAAPTVAPSTSRQTASRNAKLTTVADSKKRLEIKGKAKAASSRLGRQSVPGQAVGDADVDEQEESEPEDGNRYSLRLRNKVTTEATEPRAQGTSGGKPSCKVGKPGAAIHKAKQPRIKPEPHLSTRRSDRIALLEENTGIAMEPVAGERCIAWPGHQGRWRRRSAT